MKLIFYGRQTLPAYVPTSKALLTLERAGNICLSVGAVEALALSLKSLPLLTRDAETNTWYLLLNAPAGQEGFPVRARDKKKLTRPALQFYSRPMVAAYYEAHGLSAEKSARADIGLVPLVHEGLKLYPLTPQHATKAPALVQASPSAPVAEQPTTPDVAPLPTDLPYLAEQPAAPMLASTSATPTVDAETRLEQLTDTWYEGDFKTISESDLTELIEGLGGKNKNDRDIVENTVLNKAKTEQARRNKKGGNRG